MEINGDRKINLSTPAPDEKEIKKAMDALEDLEIQDQTDIEYRKQLDELQSRIQAPSFKIIQEDSYASQALEEAKELRLKQVSQLPRLEVPELPEVETGTFLGSLGYRIAAPYDDSSESLSCRLFDVPTSTVEANRSGRFEILLHNIFTQKIDCTATITLSKFIQTPVFLNRTVMKVSPIVFIKGNASIETLVGYGGFYEDEITLSIVEFSQRNIFHSVKDSVTDSIFNVRAPNSYQSRNASFFDPELRTTISNSTQYGIFLRVKMSIRSGRGDVIVTDILGHIIGLLYYMDIEFIPIQVPKIDLSNININL